MISVRFISIMLLLIGSIVIMIQNNGVANLAPSEGNVFFNSGYFDDVFSNLIFTFMFHHSLPGITKQLTHVSQIRKFLNIGFIAAGFTILSVSVTSNLAFGNDLIDRTASNPHDLKYYN
jgi:amino acid permease